MVYVDNLASVEAMSETVVAQGAEDRQRPAVLVVIQVTVATGGFMRLSEPETYLQAVLARALALLLVILYQTVLAVLVYTVRPLLLQLRVKEAVEAQLEVLSTMECQDLMSTGVLAAVMAAAEEVVITVTPKVVMALVAQLELYGVMAVLFPQQTQ
jgi:hypothetical protein